MDIRTRFAPSPTGFLHVGGAYSALIDFAFAKKHKGKFIIRIEDTDIKRFCEGAEEKIYQWLGWLGIKPNESPKQGGPYGPYRQSERLDLYQKYARELIEKEKAYYCFCSQARLAQLRKKQRSQKKPPMYDRHCRHLDPQKTKERVKKGEKYVIRMKVPDNEMIVVPDLIRGDVEFDSKVLDDQVLIKSNGYPTYHLAVVVDDHLMKISHVVRGEEWLSSAPKHVILYRYFDWKPPVLVHTATIRNPDRSKLSKRQGHTSLEWYQEKGYLPEALINFLCLLGWSHPQEKDIFSLEEFIKDFELKDLSPVGPVFDLKKLDWLNGVYIRKKSSKDLFQLISAKDGPASGRKPFAPKGFEDTLIKKTIPLVKERMVNLADYPGLVEFLIKKPKIDLKLLVEKGGKDKQLIESQLKTSLKAIKKITWEAGELEATLRSLARKNFWPISKFFMVMRIAITGKTVTPPLFQSMELLGETKTVIRLKNALKKLS